MYTPVGIGRSVPVSMGAAGGVRVADVLAVAVPVGTSSNACVRLPPEAASNSQTWGS